MPGDAERQHPVLDRFTTVEPGPPRRYVSEEAMRAALAGTFVVIFFLTICAAVSAAAWGNWQNMKELLQLLLPAETALLGSAVGYYFGTMKGRSR